MIKDFIKFNKIKKKIFQGNPQVAKLKKKYSKN